MKYWIISFRIYWNKVRYATVQFVEPRIRKMSSDAAHIRAVHYWKYNWQLHNHNDSYYSIPKRFVVVSETTKGKVPGVSDIPAGRFHPRTTNTVTGNVPARA